MDARVITFATAAVAVVDADVAFFHSLTVSVAFSGSAEMASKPASLM